MQSPDKNSGDGGWGEWAGPQRYVFSTVTGLAGTRSSRGIFGLSGAHGIAGRGLRVTWAAGKAEREKQSITFTTFTSASTPAVKHKSRNKSAQTSSSVVWLTLVNPYNTFN